MPELAIWRPTGGAGGSCASLYSNELETLAPGDGGAGKQLRKRVTGGQLMCFYSRSFQPSDRGVAAFRGATCGWRTSSKGLISPAEFISIPKQERAIVSLGRFARNVPTPTGALERYFPIQPPLFVRVNFSRPTDQDSGFESLDLTTIWGSSGICRRHVHLEINGRGHSLRRQGAGTDGAHQCTGQRPSDR